MPKSDKKEPAATGAHRVKNAIQQALQDAFRVLSDPEVLGATKRDILMTLVDKVVCHTDGVEVIFVPGLFAETENTDTL